MLEYSIDTKIKFQNDKRIENDLIKWTSFFVCLWNDFWCQFRYSLSRKYKTREREKKKKNNTIKINPWLNIEGVMPMCIEDRTWEEVLRLNDAKFHFRKRSSSKGNILLHRLKKTTFQENVCSCYLCYHKEKAYQVYSNFHFEPSLLFIIYWRNNN